MTRATNGIFGKKSILASLNGKTHKYIMVPRRAIERLREDALVYLYLISNSSAWHPTYSQAGSEIGVPESTFRNHVNSLRDKKLVHTEIKTVVDDRGRAKTFLRYFLQDPTKIGSEHSVEVLADDYRNKLKTAGREHPYIKIPKAVLKMGLSSQALRLSMYLLDQAEGIFKPTFKEITKVTGMSSKSIAPARLELIQRSIISWTPTDGGCGCWQLLPVENWGGITTEASGGAEPSRAEPDQPMKRKEFDPLKIDWKNALNGTGFHFVNYYSGYGDRIIRSESGLLIAIPTPEYPVFVRRDFKVASEAEQAAMQQLCKDMGCEGDLDDRDIDSNKFSFTDSFDMKEATESRLRKCWAVEGRLLVTPYMFDQCRLVVDLGSRNIRVEPRMGGCSLELAKAAAETVRKKILSSLKLHATVKMPDTESSQPTSISEDMNL